MPDFLTVTTLRSMSSAKSTANESANGGNAGFPQKKAYKRSAFRKKYLDFPGNMTRFTQTTSITIPKNLSAKDGGCYSSS
jgi:hypothetical protein